MEQDEEFKQSVIELLVISHIYKAEHENNPRQAISDLLDYHMQIATDPLVSKPAQDLLDKGKEAAKYWKRRTLFLRHRYGVEMVRPSDPKD